LLDPGDTPHENAQFLVFAGAVIRAVDKFAPLLRSTIASAGNDHRLGANEAPPAIISIYLGDQLADVFEQIKAGGATTSKQRGTLKIGVDVLPELPKDAGDRNRTSPFAFTGNRFEFRAVGANQSISGPLIAMNTILADSLEWMASKLEGATDLNKAIQDALKEVMDKHGRIIFNGNGYSEEWHAEAAERGLPNLKTSADALPAMTGPEVVEVFEKYGVLSETELKSRHAILCEQYEKVVNVEAKLVAEINKEFAALSYGNDSSPPMSKVQMIARTLPNQRPKINCLYDSDNDCITDDPDRLTVIAKKFWGDKWQAKLINNPRRFFRDGYGKRIRRPPVKITLDMIEEVIHATNDSAPGPNTIPFAAYRAVCHIAAPIFLEAVTALMRGDPAPPGFNAGILHLLPKKATDRIEDSRPLVVNNTDNRIIATIVLASVSPAIEDILSDDQNGFRAGR